MPLYEAYCPCGNTEDFFSSVTERHADAESLVCSDCGKNMLLGCGNAAIIAGVASAYSKTPQDFRDLMKKINKDHRGCMDL